MKKILNSILAVVAVIGLTSQAKAGVTILDDYIILNATGSGAANVGQNYYDVKNDSGLVNPNFNASNLGTFNILATDVTIGATTYTGNALLQLKGAELKTTVPSGGDYQNSGNFGRLYYAVTSASVNPGSFTALNMSLTSEAWPNYTWANTADTVNILQGLAVGSYHLTAYFETNGSWWDGSAQQYYSINPDNNGGPNYVATFAVVPEPSTGLLMGLGLIGLAAVRRFRKNS